MTNFEHKTYDKKVIYRRLSRQTVFAILGEKFTDLFINDTRKTTIIGHDIKQIIASCGLVNFIHRISAIVAIDTVASLHYNPSIGNRRHI